MANNTEAKRFLRDTAKNFNIDPWEVIQYTFATTLVEEARSISNYELVPFPVMDVFLEHGKNFIGSAFWKSICEITYIYLRTVWISTSETIAIWIDPAINISAGSAWADLKSSAEREGYALTCFTKWLWLWICTT